MKVFIFIPFLVFSCTTEKAKQKSFEIDLPKDYKTTESIFEVKKIARYIGLDSLEKPSDTLRLRITIGFGIIAGINVYELNYIDSSWIGTHYHFQEKGSNHSYLKNRQHDGFNDEVDSVWIVKKINPICGWKNFIDTINSSGILNLPDQDNIPDCHIAGYDGETYVFEWSNNTKYRYYTFWAFSKSQCIENKIFQAFRSFFISQLGFFEYYWPRVWVEKNDNKKPSRLIERA